MNYLLNKVKNIKKIEINNMDNLDDYFRYLKTLENTIDEFYDNNLCYFQCVKKYNHKNTRPIDSYISFTLKEIKFLEFVFGRVVEKEDSFELIYLVGIKAFISFKDLLTDLNMNTTKIEDGEFIYLKSKKNIKDFLVNIVIEENPANLYCFFSSRMRYVPIELQILFSDGIFRVRALTDLYYYSYYSKKNNDISSQFFCNSKYVFSVKERSYLSIINMWAYYMCLNSLYYSIEDKKIYKKEENNYNYFGELNYLSDNLYIIYIFFLNSSIIRVSSSYILYLVENELDRAKDKIKILAPFLFPLVNEEKYNEFRDKNGAVFNEIKSKYNTTIKDMKKLKKTYIEEMNKNYKNITEEDKKKIEFTADTLAFDSILSYV
jgi:hypothetical protein